MLCTFQLLGGALFQPLTVQAGTAPGSDVYMEEYDNGKDYTGWYTVTVKVVDDATGDPLEGIYVTLNSKDKGDAGHGPNINGIKEYMTDRDGLLEFRIYPSPVTYAAIVSAGQKGYAALEQYVGAITKDFSIIELRLKKEDPTPTPIVKPTASPTPTVKPTASPTPTVKPTASPTPTVKPTASPTPTVKPTATPNNNNTPKPTMTPVPTQTARPGARPTPKPDKITQDEYVIPGADNKTGTEDDITVRPGKDDDGNNNSSIDKDGNVDLPDGGEVIVPVIPDRGDTRIDVPEGTVIDPDGTIHLPENDQKTEITLPGRDTILDTEDDVIVRPGLDENGKNNANIDETGKVDLPDGGEIILPTQPDKGDIRVDVPGGTTVDPDGTIHLPENDQKTEITLPGKDTILDTEDDVIVRPGLDENGKNNANIDETGKVDLPDGGEIILPTQPDKGDIRVDVPGGTTVDPDGTIHLPEDDQQTDITLPGKDATLDTPDDIFLRPELDESGKNNSTIDDEGTVNLPDGGRATFSSEPDAGRIGVILPPGSTITPDGTITIPDGTKKGYVLPGKDAALDTEDDVIVDPFMGNNGKDNSVLREDGSIYLPDGGTVTYADGTVIEVPGGTIVLPDGTIIWPTNAEAKYIGFWDCMFHWFEVMILLLLIILLLTRLHWLKQRKKELEEMTKAGWVNHVDPEWLTQIEEQQKKTGIIFYAAIMTLASLCMILFYIYIPEHCIVDVPMLVLTVIADLIFIVLLAVRERDLKNQLEENHSNKKEDADKN